MLDKILCISLLIKLLIVSAYSDEYLSEQECSDRIHRRCNHPEKYTEQEIDNVKIWLQKRYAKTNPKAKPCAKLYVRKDIKCMSENEINDLIDVLKQLYSNGVVDRFVIIHDKYWAATHKFSEGPYWHFWFMSQFEKEMMKINPKVTLPYWRFSTEFTGAEKSIVFDIFGRGGKQDKDFCVLDGRLPNITCNFPNSHCVRRQWNPDNTMQAWEPPEWNSAIMQMGIRPEVIIPAIQLFNKYANLQQTVKSSFLLLSILKEKMIPTQLNYNFAALAAFTYHFKPHFSIGGYAGDMSITISPCDFTFYLFHEGGHVNFIKWSLQNDVNLVPRSYSLGIRLLWESQNITISDINTDTFTYYINATLREVFQIGFGEQCYIHDVFIKPINDIINKKKHKLPKAYYRLKKVLPPKIFAKYFPKFALYPKAVTIFDYDFENIGNCNNLKDGICREMPVAQKYLDTANGRRQYQAFIDLANIDISHVVNGAESLYLQFMKDMKHYGYCSQYA